MKRMASLLLAALLAMSLTACQDEKRVEGLVVEVQTDASGDVTAFVMENERNQTGILIAEKTTVWPMGISSGTSAEYWAQFQKELRVDALASAWCYSRREKLETAEGKTVRAYWATSVEILGGLEREALTLRDGTPVDLLERDGQRSRTYRLSDGTELLRVEEPFGPENVYVMGLESVDDLSETAKEKVRQYYEEQGPLYDELEALERAYAACRELGEEFQAGHIYQDTSPAASGERVMYFTTELTLPEDYSMREHRTVSIHAAFDRETGEKIDSRDLFAVPEEEVRRRLPELVEWELPSDVMADMTSALDLEWIGFGRDGLYIVFPAGSLPSEELDYHVSVDCKNIPEGFIQPWAVPEVWAESS